MIIDKKYYNPDTYHIVCKEPLNQQNWKNLDEATAKMLLQYIDENKYANLECLDCPDLQMPDKTLGIEVTSVISESEGAVAGNLSKYADEKSDERKKEKAKKNLEKAGCKMLFPGVISWPTKLSSDEENNLINAYSRKIQKLAEYKEKGSKKVGLFLLNNNPTIRYNFNNFADTIKSKFPEKDYDIVFYSSANKILVIDENKNLTKIITIDKKDYEALLIMARDIVNRNIQTT